MPTPSTTEIINVTTDVYHEKTAIEHFQQEEKAGTYLPLLHIRTVKIKGEPRTAFNICRIPTENDAAFVKTQWNVMRKRAMTYPFVAVAEMKNLCVVAAGEIVRSA